MVTAGCFTLQQCYSINSFQLCSIIYLPSNIIKLEALSSCSSFNRSEVARRSCFNETSRHWSSASMTPLLSMDWLKGRKGTMFFSASKLSGPLHFHVFLSTHTHRELGSARRGGQTQAFAFFRFCVSGHQDYNGVNSRTILTMKVALHRTSLTFFVWPLWRTSCWSLQSVPGWWTRKCLLELQIVLTCVNCCHVLTASASAVSDSAC